MNFKKLEYLDLEIKNYNSIKVNLSENFKIHCNIHHLENQYKHIPHTSNSQQNFIVDLIINLGKNLEKDLTSIDKIIKNNSTTTLRNNLDFIKNLLEDFTTQVKRFPSKKEIIELINLIDIKTPKPLEIEISNIVKNLKFEVENIKQTQKELAQQLELITKIVSE